MVANVCKNTRRAHWTVDDKLSLLQQYRISPVAIIWQENNQFTTNSFPSELTTTIEQNSGKTEFRSIFFGVCVRKNKTTVNNSKKW